MARSLLNIAVVAVIALLSGAALAQSRTEPQNYPARPIRIIVPNTPGSATDLVSRMVAQRLTDAISLIVVSPQMLVSHPSVPATNVEELVALARAKPGQLNCASPGTGTSNHLGCETLKVMARVDFLHVPYKGTSPAITDLMAGLATAQ